MNPLAPTPASASDRMPTDKLVLRLLATLVSVSVVGLGSLSIWALHHYGSSGRLGSAAVLQDGVPAVTMGWVLVCVGLLPLALWFRGRRAAQAWCAACVAAAGVCLYLVWVLAPGAAG